MMPLVGLIAGMASGDRDEGISTMLTWLAWSAAGHATLTLTEALGSVLILGTSRE